MTGRTRSQPFTIPYYGKWKGWSGMERDGPEWPGPRNVVFDLSLLLYVEIRGRRAWDWL